MTLTINYDFEKRVVVLPEQHNWQTSPMQGVTRVMLDRLGNEKAIATSFVSYEANSFFSNHTHDGGEEFFVMEGVFSDEHGSYPKGSYVRNPIGTSHAPKIGEEGAVIFVKLSQFDLKDNEKKCIFTDQEMWSQGLVTGLKVMPLHQYGNATTALVKWAPNTQFQSHQHWGGEEIVVLEGTFYDEHGVYPKGSWIRSPHLSSHTPFTKDDGAVIYVKTGHLPFMS